jgi:serine protease Do
MKYGEVRRGTIGGIIQYEKLTPQLAEEVGASSTSGALVVRMARNSDAYEAGVRPGDVIVSFNGTKIDDPSQLYRIVADARIGSTATVRVLRNGRPVDLKVPVVSDSRRRR